MPMNEEYYINLIHKHLSKESSPVENAELKAWCAQSEANQQRFDEEQVLWKLSAQAINPEDLNLDLDQEFQNLQDLIRDDEERNERDDFKVIDLESHPHQRSRTWYSVQVAAALIVLFGLVAYLGTMGAPEITLIEAVAEVETVVLPDSSVISVNKGSRISYDTPFDGSERIINLVGEAYFEVRPNPSRPFIVETQNERVRVLGTSFNVRALPEEAESEVYVVEGLVEFGDLKGSSLQLAANDLARLNRKTGTLNKFANQNPNSIAWFSQNLNFEDSPLDEVILALEKLHRAKIEVYPGLEGSCRFSGSFENQDLDSSLEVLAIVFNLEIDKLGEKSYLLKGEACE